MINWKGSFVLSLSLFALAPAFAAAAPVSPRAELKQLVAELQTSPDNRALREKIIKLALTLKPAPAVPEEAERRMARGEVAVERAKDAEGFRAAAAEFQAAADAAPWLAGAYFNLAVAQEKATRYADAIRSFKLYLLAAPAAKDADAVKKKIYKLEFSLEDVAKAASPEAVAARNRKEIEALRKSFEGAVSRHDDDPRVPMVMQYAMRGAIFVSELFTSGRDPLNPEKFGTTFEYGRTPLIGRELHFAFMDSTCASSTVTISEDGNEIKSNCSHQRHVCEHVPPRPLSHENRRMKL